ncbi:Sad1/UNC-like protein [Neofusicoccum parvum]|nr:Sad1/UNC-like protein [Neofusicoccum parvum]
MCKLGRHVFLAAVFLHTVAFADATTDTTALAFAAHPSISSLPPVSTCRSKEINYITHTLPQQCLKSRPTTPPAATAANATAAPEGGPSASVPAPAGGEAAGTARNGTVQSSSTPVQASASSDEAPAAVLTGSQSAAGSAQPAAATAQSDGQKPAEPEPEVEGEADSPLDNANFLSFEEWKKQNLAKAGQSPENVGQGRGTAGAQGARKPRPVNINSELDFLGEDTEIELDFGFGNKADRAAAISASGAGAKEASAEDEAARELAHRPKSKDAGKTCKERFNYASFDCAATVLKTNPQCKSSSSLLVENKDSYMLNECGAENKFVIAELCDDILVDTVVLANFEFFSSMFRTFRVSVSDRYPVKLERWKELGTFEARNSRDIQAFLVENPLIWARYLRIEFLSHYGNEFYCPVSLLRVHGTTMMEEFRHQEEAARGDEDMDEVIESESQALPPIQPNAQDPPPVEYIEEQSRILRDAFSKVEKRQLGKTEKFLDQLNSTVMAELREFRQQYDQLWQSTVIELENRREQHQREMLAISTRLTLLADELVFQKRMAVVQSTLILLCLGLVLFVRSGSSYLELPLVQQMMQKSQTALRLQFDSPSSSPPPGGYRRHGHSSSTEEHGARSPALEFSPPTPTSDMDGEGMLSREQSPEPLRKTHSSPSTPRGFRDSSKLSWERAHEAKVLGVGDGQALMRRRSPLRSGESVGDFYEGEQDEQEGSGKAGGADPNQPGDSGRFSGGGDGGESAA